MKPNCIANPSLPPTGEAVQNLAAAFAAEEGTTAAWKVVRPKGKSKGGWKNVHRPKAGTSSAKPDLKVANAPEDKRTAQLVERERKRKLKQQRQKERRKLERQKLLADAQKVNAPGPSFFYKQRKTTTPTVNAPPAEAKDSSKADAVSVGFDKGYRSKHDNRYNRHKRATMAKARTSQAPRQSEAVKRARLDDTISPRGDRKKQRVEVANRVSYAEIVQNKLCVAITRADNHPLSEEQATMVKKFLTSKILEDVKNPNSLTSPRFKGKPIISDGALKLWCEDEASLQWLTAALDSVPSPACPRLVVVKQGELTRKIRAALLLPDCEYSMEDINLVLDSLNKWAKVNTWTVYTHKLQEDGAMFLTLGIPEGIVPTILQHERKLFFTLGNVYVRFFAADGTLQNEPPRGAPEVKHSQEQMPGTSGCSAFVETKAPSDGVKQTATPLLSSPKESGSAISVRVDPGPSSCKMVEDEMGESDEEGILSDGDPDLSDV